MSSRGIERAVETNQRHLIKKILARYPSQWTFFRELVQNADDACAKNVVIEFETVVNKEGARVVSRTVVSNDGLLFSEEDWSRLTSIASGNPAVDKIGFFGVGFYCVFSLSENPTVSSGTKALEFFWKGNALYTRETTQEKNDDWTRFCLPVADVDNSSPAPDMDEIGGFLAELLCFTKHLRNVQVICDKELQVTASREDEFSLPLTFPTGLTFDGDDSILAKINRTLGRGTPVRFLAKKNASSVARTKLSMKRYHGTGPSKRIETSSVAFLRAQAMFRPQLCESDARAYLDMTQKSHPPVVTLQLLVSLDRKPKNSDTEDPTKKAEFLLWRKLSPVGCKGRVFVGFITSQTVGSVHVGGPFVPTMERENLDFATPIARDWNLALFQITGVLARVLHETICASPQTFFVKKQILDVIEPTKAAEKKDSDGQDGSGKRGFSFFNVFKKATSMFTALAQDSGLIDVDEEAADDDALYSALEEDSGAIVVTSMAIFAPIFTECRPFAGVGPQVWRGFLAREFEDGPRVWTSQGKALSSDKCRLFPPSDADLPQLATIESFPVVPANISRSRPVGYRSSGGLASAFLDRLREDKQIAYFDLADIVSELQKRPLRGIQETLAFVEWFFRPKTVSLVTVRCGNCGSITKIRSTVTDFQCASCRIRLSFAGSSGGSSGSYQGREAELRKTLLGAARCILDESKPPIKLSSWRYRLDDSMQPHLALVTSTLSSSVLEQLCPYEITKMSSVELDLEPLTFSRFLHLFLQSYDPESSLDAYWNVMAVFVKHFSQDNEAIQVATSMPSVPTSTNGNVLALPRLVYTTDLSDTHSEKVLVLSPLPDWLANNYVLNREIIKFLTTELGCRESLSPEVVVSAFMKGNLPRNELWRFIKERVVEGKEKLGSEQIKILSQTKCMARAEIDPNSPGNSKASQESFAPSSLYAPSKAVLELNDDTAPVVIFEGLEYGEAAGLVAFAQRHLGLKQPIPSRDVLLSIASSDLRAKEVRMKAIVLLLQNEDPSFDFSGLALPIIPCKGGIWANPGSCFLEVPSFLLEFDKTLKICDLDNQGLAKRLGVKQFPPCSKCIDCLERILSKPSDVKDESIDAIIDHLVTKQMHEMRQEDFNRLSQVTFIPVPETCVLRDRGYRFAQPRTCFFESDQDDADLKVLFCFVSKTAANRTARHRPFLQNLGVRDAPTLSELASQISNSPKETLSKLGAQNYLNLLRSLASDLNKIKAQVRVDMSTKPCLLGKCRKDDGSEDWDLFHAWDICIEDDSRYRRLFSSVPSCPLEAPLEQMYLRLGSLPISQLVQEICAVQKDAAQLTREATAMERRLCERISVLTQRVSSDELNMSRVKYWTVACERRRKNRYEVTPHTLDHVMVLQVPSIACELKLTMRRKTITKAITSTACVFENRLYITNQIDFFHVASALVSDLCAARSNDRALLWATLLQSTDQSLEEMGFVLPKGILDPPPSLLAGKKRLLADDTKPERDTNGLQSEAESSKRVPDPSSVAPPSVPDATKSSTELLPKPNVPVPTMPSPPSACSGQDPCQVPGVCKLPHATVSPAPDKEAGRSNSPTPEVKREGMVPLTDNPPVKSGPTPTESATSLIKRTVMSALKGGNDMGGVRLDPTVQRKSEIEAAIAMCRASEANGGRLISPPSETTLLPPMVDCTQPHDLVRDEGIGSIECYVQRGSSVDRPFATYMDKAREFSNLLLQLGIEVFGLDPTVIHLYWDERGTTRAFNRAGSLFFNLHCYLDDRDSIKNVVTWKRWFGTMAHEITHNLYKNHDAQFAKGVEIFCVEFAGKLLQSLSIRGLV